MCIGGELEHQNALPLSSSKKQSTNGVLCSPARCIYSQIVRPGLWLEPVLMASLSSRVEPQTGTSGCGPGARPIDPGSCLEPGHMPPDEPGPMLHEARPAPGRTNRDV